MTFAPQLSPRDAEEGRLGHQNNRPRRPAALHVLMRTRGLSPDTARQMLIHAFAGEIIERIQCAPVREELDKLVWDRLEANPHLK